MPDQLLSADPKAGQLLSSDPKAASVAPANPSTNEGLAAALTAHLTPLIQDGLEAFAKNPNVPAAFAKLGRVIGGVAPVAGGAAAAGIPGAGMGLAGAAKGAWAGGKTGWFSGKLAQGISQTIAETISKAEPYMAGLNTLGGVQSGLDLAQMDDPNRQDIGMYGIGKSPTFQPRLMMVDGRPTMVSANKDITKLYDSKGNDLTGKKITQMPGAK